MPSLFSYRLEGLRNYREVLLDDIQNLFVDAVHFKKVLQLSVCVKFKNSTYEFSDIASKMF